MWVRGCMMRITASHKCIYECVCAGRLLAKEKLETAHVCGG